MLISVAGVLQWAQNRARSRSIGLFCTRRDAEATAMPQHPGMIWRVSARKSFGRVHARLMEGILKLCEKIAKQRLRVGRA